MFVMKALQFFKGQDYFVTLRYNFHKAYSNLELRIKLKHGKKRIVIRIM